MCVVQHIWQVICTFSRPFTPAGLQVTRTHDRADLDCAPGHDLLPAWHLHSSPLKSALRQWAACDNNFYGHKQDASVLQQYHSHSPAQHQYRQSSSMDMLCRDMQQLDAQIADLDLNLATASHRLHN